MGGRVGGRGVAAAPAAIGAGVGDREGRHGCRRRLSHVPLPPGYRAHLRCRTSASPMGCVSPCRDRSSVLGRAPDPVHPGSPSPARRPGSEGLPTPPARPATAPPRHAQGREGEPPAG
ncbi:unnamed protein product, partial [Ectocarpus sp. 12 AP-2014]